VATPYRASHSWNTPGTPINAAASHTKVSFTWTGGAKRMPACLKISSHPPIHDPASRRTVQVPGRMINHGPPIVAA
jgi:lysozyme family protein